LRHFLLDFTVRFGITEGSRGEVGLLFMLPTYEVYTACLGVMARKQREGKNHNRVNSYAGDLAVGRYL
jgi:hypothetical protein